MKCPQNAFLSIFLIVDIVVAHGFVWKYGQTAGRWSMISCPIKYIKLPFYGIYGHIFQMHIGYLTIADYLDSTEGCKDTHWARWHGEERLVRRLGRYPGHPVGEFLWKFDGAAILIYSNGVHHHFSHENWLFGHILIHFFNIFSHSHGVGVGSVKPCHAHATWVLL